MQQLSNKEINLVAQTLPVVFKRTIERHWVDGAELISQGHTHDQNGIAFLVGMTYEQEMPVMIALNHRRNLKKINNKSGIVGVAAYVAEIQHIHKQQQDETGSTSKDQRLTVAV